MRQYSCCGKLHAPARLDIHHCSRWSIATGQHTTLLHNLRTSATHSGLDRVSASKELIFVRRSHAIARSCALATAQKPLGRQSLMDQVSSKPPITPMPVGSPTPERSKSRKGTTAASAPVAVRQAIGVQPEQPPAAKKAKGSQPEIVVETSGLATALELTGSAEPKTKRARKGAKPAAVAGPATPALERARSRPVADADSPQDKKDQALAALASALRAVRAAPGKGKQGQQEGATAVAGESMPPIPLAERVKGRARRAKTAPSDLEAMVKAEEEGVLPKLAAEAPQKKPRKRAVKVAASAAIEGDVAPPVPDLVVPAKMPRAPRKKPAATQAAAAEQPEELVILALLMAPDVLLELSLESQ
jgi:hypothetical protein